MAEFIGPINQEKEPYRGILDTIVARAVGTKEDRGTKDMDFSNMRMGPMAARSSKFDKYELPVGTIAKSMIYTMSHAFNKEEVNHGLSVLDGVLNFNLKNNTTNLEKDAAKKFNLLYPTRIDDNSLLSIFLDTYEKLPKDLKLKVDSNINLAKDMDWNALLEGNNLGIAYNSKEQEIHGFYNVKVGKDDNPISITPSVVKNNKVIVNGEALDDFTMFSTTITQGDAPPKEPNIENFAGNLEAYSKAMNNYNQRLRDWKTNAPPEAPNIKDYPGDYKAYVNAFKNYEESFKSWEKNKDKMYWAIDLKADPESDFTSTTGKVKIKNVSGYVDVKKQHDLELQDLKLETFIDTKLSKHPLELYAQKYIEKDDEKASSTTIGAKLPIKDSSYLYAKNVDSDWKGEDGLTYGLGIDKTGKLGNFDYNLLANIDQDKDYSIQGGLNTDFLGGQAGVDGYIDADGNWQALAGIKWKYGDGDKKLPKLDYEESLIKGFVKQDGDLVAKSEKDILQDKEDYENWMAYKMANPGYILDETFRTSDVGEVLEFVKEKEILPDVDLVDNKAVFTPRYYNAKGGRVRMASGGIVGILKL